MRNREVLVVTFLKYRVMTQSISIKNEVLIGCINCLIYINKLYWLI